MVYYDDVTVGEVIRFDNRPGRMYGWIKITEGDAEDIGKTIWFHYNDGEFLQGWSGAPEWASPVYFGTSDPHSKFTQDVTSRDPFDGARLRLPEVGDRLVFQYWEVGDGKVKAQPWTYAEYFQEVELRADAPYHIIREDGAELWRGYYHHQHGILTTAGQLPRELDDTMKLEWRAPDDVAEAIHPSDADLIIGYPIPGGWEEYFSPEKLWQELVAAKPFKITQATSV